MTAALNRITIFNYNISGLRDRITFFSDSFILYKTISSLISLIFEAVTKLNYYLFFLSNSFLHEKSIKLGLLDKESGKKKPHSAPRT